MQWCVKTRKPIRKWFAWHPVKIGGTYFWLETIHRKWISAAGDGFWQYGKTYNDLANKPEHIQKKEGSL